MDGRKDKEIRIRKGTGWMEGRIRKARRNENKKGCEVYSSDLPLTNHANAICNHCHNEDIALSKAELHAV